MNRANARHGQHRATSTCRIPSASDGTKAETGYQRSRRNTTRLFKSTPTPPWVRVSARGFQGSRPQRPGQFSSFQPSRRCERDRAWDRKSQGRAKPSSLRQSPTFPNSRAEPKKLSNGVRSAAEMATDRQTNLGDRMKTGAMLEIGYRTPV